MSDEEETTGTEEKAEGEVTATVQEAPAAVATDAPKPEKPANELKVVIILKGNRAMLGVQSPDCDPVYKTMEGDLAAILQVVPTLVADARLQWFAAPRYPKADLPKPVTPATTTTSAISKPATKTAQPKFF